MRAVVLAVVFVLSLAGCASTRTYDVPFDDVKERVQAYWPVRGSSEPFTMQGVPTNAKTPALEMRHESLDDRFRVEFAYGGAINSFGVRMDVVAVGEQKTKVGVRISEPLWMTIFGGREFSADRMEEQILDQIDRLVDASDLEDG